MKGKLRNLRISLFCYTLNELICLCLAFSLWFFSANHIDYRISLHGHSHVVLIVRGFPFPYEIIKTEIDSSKKNADSNGGLAFYAFVDRFESIQNQNNAVKNYVMNILSGFVFVSLSGAFMKFSNFCIKYKLQKP